MSGLRHGGWTALLLAAVLGLGLTRPAVAQSLPSEPLVFGAGRVTLSGDVSATFSCGDGGDAGSPCGEDRGYFNYTDYGRSILRLLRLDLSAAVKASRRITILGDLRSENGGAPQPYGLYVRIRPWLDRNLDLQIGRLPPTFGGFARRTYPVDNLLVGYPLAYQYLTSLRPDALPANTDELLRMRGRGWRSSFSVGDRNPDNGLPIASGVRWDTGVQVHAASSWLDASAALTTGSLGDPLVSENNAGKQLAGRLALRPASGLVLGASAARAPYLSRQVVTAAAAAPRAGHFTQTAFGLDAEYSRDYYLLRVESIVSRWRLPLSGPPATDLPLRALATSIEGRYKLHPAVYVAGRVDQLGFSTVRGTEQVDTWDAPVSRQEVVVGYSLERNLLLKLAFQHNRRDGGRVDRLHAGAVQLLFWF